MLNATLSVSVKNLKEALLGVGIVELATFAMALRNQFGGTNASSSGVYTGGLKTEDRSIGKCDLLINCSSASLHVSKRAWFLLKDAKPFFVGGGKSIGSPDTDARLFIMIGFRIENVAFFPIMVGFRVNTTAFTGNGFQVNNNAFTCGLFGFLAGNNAFAG